MSILGERFFKLSNALFCYHLTPIQFTVYSFLVSSAGQKERCWPSMKTIAASCGCSVNAAREAATSITATLSSQAIYVDGQRVTMTAYSIGGNNYVKLRDIGRAVDFGVTYDAATNSVHIDSTQSYQEESAPSTSTLSEENIQAAILALKKVYPHGAVYPAPYRPNNPLDRPFSNCDHCAGWAMLCSDAAFGDLPWRQIYNPRWEDIRVGDVIDYRNEQSGHAIVVIEKTDEYVKVTESGINNHALWGGQYPRWWLEQQPGYCLNTRYPE